MTTPSLSLVLPTYQARELTLRTLGKLTRFLADEGIEAEVLVVDDGSRVSERLVPERLPDPVRLIQLEQNRGKGYAVRTGMLEARGRARMFTDIDLPYDLSAIPYALERIERGALAVFGDRSHGASQVAAALRKRRQLASRAFTKLVSLLVISGIGDSQCGFKAFSAPLAEALFPLLTVDGFAFDVELYYVLLKHDLPIEKIPVRLIHSDVSSVSTLRHGARMAASILSLPVAHRLGRYESAALRALHGSPYWEGTTRSERDD